MRNVRYLSLLTAALLLMLANVGSAQDVDDAPDGPVPLDEPGVIHDSQSDSDMSDMSDMMDPMVDAADIPAPDDQQYGEACAYECDGPVHLFNDVCGIQVGGWINGGIYQNSDGVNSGTGNLPVLFSDVSDGFMMNQFWIYAEKGLPDVEEYGCCYGDWGFRMDYVFGVDGPDTQAFGDENWDNQWDSSRDYGSAIPQLYFEFGNSDMSIKAGHFYTIIGYEVVPAPQNFFYSHSYTLLYAEPFTHTGFMVSKQVNDQIAVTGGYTMGWDSGFSNANDAHTFLGSIGWTSCDERTSAIYAVNFGDFGEGEFLDDPGGVNGNAGDVYMHSIVVSHQIHECLEYVFQHDYFNNSGLQQFAWHNGNGSATAGGINQYLFYTLNSCMKLGLRAEWFSDPDGARVATNDPTYGGGDFFALTAGVNYTPTSNVVVRPELRYDTFDGDGMPFADGTATDQMFYGFDVILIY